MKVLMTGSASPLGAALLHTLAADERIEQIIGLDSKETTYSGPRFTQVVLDVRSPQVTRIMARLDAVVHVASAAALDSDSARRDPALFNDLTVHAAQNIILSALEHSLRCVVHLSSAAVYALPPRQRPITEQHPCAALPGFAWAEGLVQVEEWLDTLSLVESDSRLVRLRPALIVGRGASPRVESLLNAMFAIGLAGRPPRLNCVHVDDVASAIRQALFHKDVHGVFNLGCANAATLTEMQRLRGRGFVPLPFALIYHLRRLARYFGRDSEPAWMEAFRHELVLDSSRARRRLGWKPRYDTVESCLTAAD